VENFFGRQIRGSVDRELTPASLELVKRSPHALHYFLPAEMLQPTPVTLSM